MKKWIGSRLNRKLCLCFLIVSLIPLCLVYFYINSRYSEKLRSDAVVLNQLADKNTAILLEDYLTKIEYISNLFYDNDVQAIVRGAVGPLDNYNARQLLAKKVRVNLDLFHILDDVDQVILDSGEIVIESVKNQGERVLVRGKMDFNVLYRKSEGGLQALGGSISFEEPINVPGLEEKDYVQLGWDLEDLNAGMINSRKLSIKAIVTLEVKVETLYDVEAAVELDTGMSGAGAPAMMGGASDLNGTPQVEVLRRNVDVAAIAVRRKDTYRIKENLQLSGNKPNIDHILWSEMKLRGITTRPLDGKMVLDGELMVFVIYQGEGEDAPVQWLEESIPFTGELDLSEASAEMVPSV